MQLQTISCECYSMIINFTLKIDERNKEAIHLNFIEVQHQKILTRE